MALRPQFHKNARPIPEDIPMKKLLLALVPALLFAACGHDHAHGSASDHPLGGQWVQQLGGDAKGFGLEFDTKSDACEMQTAPAADGYHEHHRGTYTFDAATKAVTVKVKLLGDGKSDSWAGTLGTGVIELTGGTDKVTLKPGKIAGH